MDHLLQAYPPGGNDELSLEMPQIHAVGFRKSWLILQTEIKTTEISKRLIASPASDDLWWTDSRLS
jgi:hypothetical protein